MNDLVRQRREIKTRDKPARRIEEGWKIGKTSPVTGRVEEEVGRTGREEAAKGCTGNTKGKRREGPRTGRGCTKMLALGRTLRGKGVPGGKPQLNGPDGAHRRSRSNPILGGEKEKMPVC